MAKERNKTIDTLRGVAAILMILGHSFIVYPIDVTTVPWCRDVGHFIYTFHMELFFMLAGVVYKRRPYRGFIAGKARRLLVPYFFFGTVTLLLKAYGGKAIHGNESVLSGLEKLLFHGGSYWFLYVLFLVFATWPVLESVCGSPRRQAALALALLLLLQWFPPKGQWLFSLQTVWHYYPYFLFGRIMSKWALDNRTVRNIRPPLRLAAMTAALAVFLLLDGLERRGPELRGLPAFVRAAAVCALLYMLLSSLPERLPAWAVLAESFLSDCG